jgi:uncharacterized protein (TIGR03437 family)
MPIRALLPFSLFLLSVGIAQPQSSPFTCTTGAVNPALHAEGIAEVVGDILLNCTGGSPGTAITVNLAISLNVGVTNRVSTTGSTDVSLTVDSGSGPTPPAVPGVLQTTNTVSFNGVSFTVPASQRVNFRVSNLRGNVSQMGAGFQQPILASLTLSGLPLVSSLNPVSVGIPGAGLLASYASTGIRCVGSALPSTLSFSSLYNFGTRFASTRVTEGFPDSFQPKTATSDAGVRIMARYSHFPPGSRLFVPTIVAGSDALQPTAAGDLGGTPSDGAYAPGSGTLLLALVNGTDANGAGGTVSFRPGPAGSPTVSSDAVSEVSLTNGSGVAVYEVVDSSPNVRESAQFPTFIGLPPITDGSTPVASEQVSFAPVSTVLAATTTDPVPRFVGNAPPSDCPSLADCNAGYFPALSVFASQPLQFTAIAASAPQTKTVQVNNNGGGVLSWTASTLNGNAVNWLAVSPGGGVNGGTVLVTVYPQNVGPGVYTATLLIDGGPQAGSQTLPITFTVTAFPPANPTPTPAPTPTPTPTPSSVLLQSIANAALPSSTAVSPGSLAIVKGAHLKGANVTVTFDGTAAAMQSGDDSSITVLLPTGLTPGVSSQLQVTVDGDKSAPLAVPISDLAPAIFANGVFNEDNSVNSESNPATVGTALQIFSTGLIPAIQVPIMVKLHDRQLTPLFAGPAPGETGVNQVNVIIPSDLPAMTTQVSVCGYGMMNPSQPICSPPMDLTLQQPAQ